MTADDLPRPADEIRADLHDDIHAEIGYYLHVDDTYDEDRDAKNAATDAILKLIDREQAALLAQVERLSADLAEARRENERLQRVDAHHRSEYAREIAASTSALAAARVELGEQRQRAERGAYFAAALEVEDEIRACELAGDRAGTDLMTRPVVVQQMKDLARRLRDRAAGSSVPSEVKP